MLHLKVHGTLADNSKVVLTQSVTSPIVVRGRSPRNFQARKEIPLLGSSAGSRGQALVETGVGVIASALPVKPEIKRSGSLDMQVPRSAFTFSPPKPPAGQPSALRSNSYPSWSQHTGSLGQLPTTTMGLSTSSAFASDAHELPMATSLAPPVSLSQYAPSAGALATETVPRYVDTGRSMKSPRQQGQSSVHGSISGPDNAADYRYGAYRMSIGGASDVAPVGYGSETSVQSSGAGRDYYSSTSAWVASTAETAATQGYGNSNPRPYAFDRTSGKEATLPAGNLYTSGTKGAFETTMSNYSWETN